MESFGHRSVNFVPISTIVLAQPIKIHFAEVNVSYFNRYSESKSACPGQRCGVSPQERAGAAAVQGPAGEGAIPAGLSVEQGRVRSAFLQYKRQVHVE